MERKRGCEKVKVILLKKHVVKNRSSEKVSSKEGRVF